MDLSMNRTRKTSAALALGLLASGSQSVYVRHLQLSNVLLKMILTPQKGGGSERETPIEKFTDNKVIFMYTLNSFLR